MVVKSLCPPYQWLLNSVPKPIYLSIHLRMKRFPLNVQLHTESLRICLFPLGRMTLLPWIFPSLSLSALRPRRRRLLQSMRHWFCTIVPSRSRWRRSCVPCWLLSSQVLAPRRFPRERSSAERLTPRRRAINICCLFPELRSGHRKSQQPRTTAQRKQVRFNFNRSSCQSDLLRRSQKRENSIPTGQLDLACSRDHPPFSDLQRRRPSDRCRLPTLRKHRPFSRANHRFSIRR